jgi:hypothetical protein
LVQRLCGESPRNPGTDATIPCPRRRGFFTLLVIAVSDIDWNTELRKIVREYDGLHPQPGRARQAAAPVPRPRRSPRTEFRLARIQEIKDRNRLYERLSAIGIWVRFVLVGALTVALFWWPYGRDCGLGLGAFVGSYALAIIAGILLAARTWRDRAPWPFTGTLLFIALAWTVIAMSTLPRLGYASSRTAIGGWYCAASR